MGFYAHNCLSLRYNYSFWVLFSITFPLLKRVKSGIIFTLKVYNNYDLPKPRDFLNFDNKSKTMIRINCFISVAAENRQKVLEAAVRLTKASLLQDGCIAYDIFESATRPDVLMICETWASKEALDAHSNSEVFHTEVSVMTELATLKLEHFNMPGK